MASCPRRASTCAFRTPGARGYQGAPGWRASTTPPRAEPPFSRAYLSPYHTILTPPSIAIYLGYPVFQCFPGSRLAQCPIAACVSGRPIWSVYRKAKRGAKYRNGRNSLGPHPVFDYFPFLGALLWVPEWQLRSILKFYRYLSHQITPSFFNPTITLAPLPPSM